MTIKELANQTSESPNAAKNLRRKLSRAGLQFESINSELPDDLMDHLQKGLPLSEYKLDKVAEGFPVQTFPGQEEEWHPVGGLQKVDHNELSKPEQIEWDSMILENGGNPLFMKFEKALQADEIDLIKELQIKHQAELKAKEEEITGFKILVEEEQAKVFRQSDIIKNKDANIELLYEDLNKMEKQITKLQEAMRAQINDNKITNTLVAKIALPLLAFPASYCVYVFAQEFVPFWVAIIEAAAFELTYIGLALIGNMNTNQRTLAKNVSVGAVVISIIYATIAAAIHLQPGIMNGISGYLFWGAAALYGTPLALLGYHLSKLLFNK